MGPRWTIYCHTHAASGRGYVGLTKKTMMARWNQHVYNASHRPSGARSHFWAAIRKYGKEAFSHAVLEVFSSLEEANAAEERWIEQLDTRNPERGFNFAPGGKSFTLTIRRNPWDDPVYRARMSDVCREVVSRPEVKKKIGDAARGRVFSEETRRKISANMTGRTHVTNPEVKGKISAALREHFASNPVSDERRQQVSEASRGRRASDETRRKISEAGKARYASVVRTRCVRGHDLSAENVYLNPRGVRECRVCIRSRRRRPSTSALSLGR